MTTSFCQKGSERKRRCLVDEEARAGDETSFTADGIPLNQFIDFKYLGRIITVTDDDWPAVVSNLRKARQKWARFTGFLGGEGVHARTLGQIY